MASLAVKTRCQDERELLRNPILTYLEHGGKLSIVIYQVLLKGPGSIYWLPEILMRSSEFWTVDKLSPVEICLIGTLAHADTGFRDLLKSYLAICRSPFYSDRVSMADRLYECTFGSDSVVRHFRMLGEFDRTYFSALLCRTGSVSMLQFFVVEVGIDVDSKEFEFWRPCYGTLLGVAAASGGIELVHFLLRAGANGALGLTYFLDQGHSLSSDPLYRQILALLTENATPVSPSIKLFKSDPFEPLFGESGERALLLFPEIVETLLSRRIFLPEKIFGRDSNKLPVEWSYMFKAITIGHADAVDLFLREGLQADALMADFFSFEEVGFKKLSGLTWLTLSILFGAAACAEKLIRHGADITALDGTGRSAINLAKANVRRPHPRSTTGSMLYWRWLYGNRRAHCSAEEDAETLAVLERAFNLKFKGTKSFEDYKDASPELIDEPPAWQENRGTGLDRLCAVLMSYPTVESWYYELRRLWKMSFREALFMRFLYVLSYVLLLATAALAFATGVKKVPKPSRSLLSAAAMLMLVLMWGHLCLE